MDYKCIKYASSYNALTDCKTQETGFNDIGSELIFLDRHLMQCQEPQALTGFKGTSTWPSGRFMFTYTCCGGNVNYPTLAPTLAPIADVNIYIYISIFFPYPKFLKFIFLYF